MLCQLLSCVWLFATLWTVACQTPLSMKIFRQECWSRVPFPSPGDLPNWGAGFFIVWAVKEVRTMLWGPFYYFFPLYIWGIRHREVKSFAQDHTADKWQLCVQTQAFLQSLVCITLEGFSVHLSHGTEATKAELVCLIPAHVFCPGT